MENFRKYLAQFGHLTQEQFAFIEENTSVLYLKKGAHFLKQGSVLRKSGFIMEGVMRIYEYTEKDEVTSYFLKENQFVASLESFNDGLPSEKSFQAVTDVKLMVMSYESLQQCMAVIPPLAGIVYRITEQSLLTKLNHRNPLVVEDAKTRYEKFVREHPDILLRVPLGYIASYLGVTQQSLSRLRRELAYS
jgi:CRP-like cAMP-binding protein